MSDETNKESRGLKPRLSPAEIAANFAEIRTPFSEEDAVAEAQRCYYCENDVPCVRGCPTKIDIPKFIRQIAAGKPEDAAETILDSNIFGNVCARVCPVEKLCEEKCICRTLHEKPIAIGRLQRFATDRLMSTGHLPYHRARLTGKKIAVIGAGPAGIAAAFELSRRGHDAVVFEKEPEPGGLDRYGIAEYKISAPFVREEMNYLLQLGGIEIRTGREAVDAKRIAQLMKDYDAVLLAVGMGTTRRLGVPGDDLPEVQDAMTFIRRIKTDDLSTIPVGERVVVIGAGNTAVDAATQARRLGAREVFIAYRRGRDRVKCTDHEFQLAERDGCEWIFDALPLEILAEDGAVSIMRFRNDSSECEEELAISCDHIIVAIGQEPHHWLKDVPALILESNGTVRTDPTTWMTSVPGLFAAGDCVKKAKEVVNAVYEGKSAAVAIDGWIGCAGRAILAP